MPQSVSRSVSPWRSGLQGSSRVYLVRGPRDSAQCNSLGRLVKLLSTLSAERNDMGEEVLSRGWAGQGSPRAPAGHLLDVPTASSGPGQTAVPRQGGHGERASRCRGSASLWGQGQRQASGRPPPGQAGRRHARREGGSLLPCAMHCQPMPGQPSATGGGRARGGGLQNRWAMEVACAAPCPPSCGG